MDNEIVLKKEGDIDIEEVQSETDDAESSRGTAYNILTYPADFTLKVLHDKYISGDIRVPKFQRGFVWKQAQASRLIESFMMGLPVPQIFLYTETDTNKLLVIDGQQRLKSVFYFFDGYFGEEEEKSEKRKIFRLNGIDESSKWFGKTFDQFDDADKRKLMDSVLRSLIVKQIDPKDETSIYHIFERLNTGGTLLTNQEVRNCVYPGKLNELLQELNTYKNWRVILGKPNTDSRQRDIELILRYLALFHKRSEYKKHMKDFLSKFMKHYSNPSNDFIEQEHQRFIRTCDNIVEQLGPKPFHLKGPINTSAFDAIFVTFAEYSKYPEDIKKRFENLKADPEFIKDIRGATTDPEVIRSRFAQVATIMFG